MRVVTGIRVLFGVCVAAVLLMPLARCRSDAGKKDGFAPLVAAMDNRYGLTTEETLASDEEKIQNYFNHPKEEDFFTSADREPGERAPRIHYRVYVPDPPVVSRGAIVISSGRTESSIIYPELIYDLQRQGYSVFIHDHRGQGASEKVIPGAKETDQRGHVEDFKFYVDDLHQFVETVVKRQSTPAKRFLLAHSMGGGIASLYERYPSDFAAAALVTPMHEPILLHEKATGTIAWLNRHVIPWLSKSTDYGKSLKGYDPDKFGKNDLTHSRLRYETKNAAYDTKATHKIGGATHGWIGQAYWAGEEARKEAGKIQIPVLLLQGGDDSIVGADAQVEFCRTAPRCKGFVIEKSFHAVFLEADTFRIPALTAVLDFFDHPPATQEACKAWQPGPAAPGRLTAARSVSKSSGT